MKSPMHICRQLFGARLPLVDGRRLSNPIKYCDVVIGQRVRRRASDSEEGSTSLNPAEALTQTLSGMAAQYNSDADLTSETCLPRLTRMDICLAAFWATLQESLICSFSLCAGISSSSGRVAQTRNFVLGPSDNSEEAWRALDEKVCDAPAIACHSLSFGHRKDLAALHCTITILWYISGSFLQVNTYPGQRIFKAIGVGGGAFVDSMLSAVERVIGSPIHEESVNSRPSAKGSYISVTIGPVTVQNRDQVLQTTMHQSQPADTSCNASLPGLITLQA